MKNMVVLLSVLGVLTFVALVLLEAGQAPRPTVSIFELKRRKAAHDKKASELLRREELRAQAGALKTPILGLLLVALMLLLVHLLGRGQGVVVSVAAAALYGRVAQLGFMRKTANRLYGKYEDKLLGFISKHEKKIRLLAGKKTPNQQSAPLGSREELAHLLETSSIFSADDKQLLESALSFGDKTVEDCMVKRAGIVTVGPNELLGPLVLDDLHKTKHEIFPVEDKGAVVGMLDIRDHVALRRAESVYVRDVMHANVVRINQSEPLDEALRVLVAAKQPYLIVVDDDEQTVGLIGLGDVIHELTGWKRR